MELGLRLGNDPPFGFPQKPPSSHGNVVVSRTGHDFCLAFSSANQTHNQNDVVAPPFYPPPSPPLPLDLLPPPTPLAATRRSSPAEGGGVVLKEVISGGTAEEGGVGGGESGRNPTRLSSSLEVEFGKFSNSRMSEEESGGGGGGSDEEDQNSGSKKKLRLSREQSAFLEESFKEHHTLYPVCKKQKVELARRLNLRPRQVEVWFQNRRARTKLKQTEVDCEYLKKCCETLTQQNQKLRKELQDLTALKTTHNSLFINSPPTTLTFCASCERAASTTHHTT